MKLNQGWAPLTLSDAKAFWGKPRLHKKTDYEFYTFDARSFCGEEENIYHLDLRSGDNGILIGYRIRGIGIHNQLWVDATTLITNPKSHAAEK